MNRLGSLKSASGSHGSYVDLSKFDVQEKHVLENLSESNLQQLAADAPANHKIKTRIVCTLGPVSRDVPKLEEMLRKGMNIARFNFSHGSHEYHQETLDNLRIASKNTGIRCGVLLDTKGPEIRTGMLDHGEPVFLEKDSEVTLTTDYEVKGNKNLVAVSYPSLARDVAPGSQILCADGSITFTVLSCDVDNGTVQVRCENSAKLGERKNMNLPGIIVELPTVTEKDIDDLVNFGVANRVDFIAASFVRKGSDVDHIREIMGPEGANIKIISKIENQEGLHNYDEILETTDAIMVARGDLGMEIPPEKVFLAQKMMIRKANLVGKPVVTATQMLESMCSKPRPTRAECTDVANAILDGTDAVMLSGETAGGDYPLEAVRMMASVCSEAESVTNHAQLYSAIRHSTREELGIVSVTEAVASAAVKSVHDLGASLIVVCTETGNSARLISKYRPSVPILALTATPEVANQCRGLLRGVEAHVMGSMIGTESIILRAAEMGKERGWLSSGDTIVAVHGMIEGKPGATNLCKVVICP
mmetsp:Transcript_105254/g.255516  ORF Transcript_105254/g.255516 Transcript_105254/m.255516 type:complete len:533 (-) Transcript_105254:84-1682(-)